MKRDWWSAEAASRAITAAVAIAVAIAIVTLVNWNDRRIALHEAEDKALLLINRNLATHRYFASAIRPPLLAFSDASHRPDYFDPSWMSSSFAVREISRMSNELSSEVYYYKDAAVNARNPDNEADEHERAFLAAASGPSGADRWSGVRIIGGKPFFVTMRRGETLEAGCLRCHGDPTDGPGDLVRRYGSTRSFGRKVGELVSVVSIRIPLIDAYSSADAFSARLSFVLLGALGLLFAATALVNRRLVFGPLSRVRQHAALVASGELGLADQLAFPRGREMQSLADAFNAMSAQLRGQRSDLERQVTERTNEALSSEARYQLLFDANPMPMWVYEIASAGFVAVNAAAVAHYGYSREEFLGMTLREIRPPEDVPRFETMRSQLPRTRSRTGVFRHLKKSGDIIFVEIVSHELEFMGRRCRLVLANDVTEQVQAETALRESEEQYRVITDGIPMRIGHVDAQQRFRFVNRTYEIDLGMSRTEIVGRTVREVLGEDVYAGIRPYVEAALRGEPVAFETAVHVAGGRRVNAVVYVPRRDATGNIAGFFVIAEDVTERRELERQFRQAQKMEAIGQLAGGVAHDFNNLLTVISSVAHMLSESDRLGPEDRSDVAEIQQAAARAADLTRKLLAFSSKQTLQPRYVKMDAIVADAEKILRRLVREDIELRTVLTGSGSGWVLADPAQLDQVLMNLVVNARDAMPKGGIITIASAEVDVDDTGGRGHAGMKPGRYVMLTVTDTGVGMAPNVAARAFEPFFTTKEKGQGTGLGLATVYGIVMQSGGHVQIASAPGEGTAVSIFLPRVEPQAGEQRHALPAPGSLAGTETLLLVEDEEKVRRIVNRALEARGYRVLCAANGEEALQIVGSHVGRIALVLTDAVMPGMGGAELARQVEKLPVPIPVLFMSGYAADALGDNGVLGLGVAFLQKPFTDEALCLAVRAALDGPRPLASAS